jgi:L-asparagine transporter-like permease
MTFSFTTIFFGVYLITQSKLGIKVKGLILIIDGIIPIICSIYAMADSRLNAINELRILVLLPLTLAGIFIVIYGVFLVSADMYIDNDKTKKRSNQILGLISIVIGLVNIISLVVLITTAGDQPIILSFFWLLLGVVFVYFGVHLIIKKIESKKKSSKKKK